MAHRVLRAVPPPAPEQVPETALKTAPAQAPAQDLLIRVERGRPRDDELAAVLIALLAAVGTPEPPAEPRHAVGWDRPAGFGAPGAWSSA